MIAGAPDPDPVSALTLLPFDGPANASFLSTPSPNNNPQNTPTASPAETTTGTARDVPRRGGRIMFGGIIGGPPGPPIWPIGFICGYPGDAMCPLRMTRRP